MVWLSDPAVAAVPVRERGEPLVDLRTVAALRLDSRLADEEGLYAQLRLGVVDRLVTAQTLLPPELKLLIVEGYRPQALQIASFESAVAESRARSPQACESVLRQRASMRSSPPEVAPHVAGAAVDLSLCTVDEIELDLGTAVNDTATERSHTEDPAVDATARRHRAVLAQALRGAGLVNYPSAWWHWSYGDRYWAYLTGSAQALYGPILP
ncbi:dipeptidase [Lentzea sp. NBC_00516]|uniref:M15 family metallopeptidase n=1 Tax=Lentzea sp. NBC_00516 TaxID=2903582 RepID=UPI002E81ABD6|nr:M15 family metallopeptidase [Lentzea sp. NBC_00516]WUD25154.1 dipeptidase [Lentzea sp. NBC_00516]